jgi:hypothetical protein
VFIVYIGVVWFLILKETFGYDFWFDRTSNVILILIFFGFVKRLVPNISQFF